MFYDVYGEIFCWDLTKNKKKKKIKEERRKKNKIHSLSIFSSLSLFFFFPIYLKSILDFTDEFDAIEI